MIVEGVELDLSGLQIMPGRINAHDHLEYSLFPRLGNGPYANATEWARDIYHPDRDPVRRHLQVPKPLRLIWGGLRNLLAGVTTVSHHDPYHPVFDGDFPVRVIRNYGWAHSLAFTKDVRECFDATPAGAPFLIHLGEGTDESAAREIFDLQELGALTESTVLVHAVGLDAEGWDLVKRAGAAVIWCPRSNLFTLGRTLARQALTSGVPIALGTDSSLTTEGDFLDELKFASDLARPDAAQRILRLPPCPDDWIAVRSADDPPELVVIGGQIRLITSALGALLPPHLRSLFSPLSIESRRKVLIRWNIPRLIEDTRCCLGEQIRLAGRAVAG